MLVKGESHITQVTDASLDRGFPNHVRHSPPPILSPSYLAGSKVTSFVAQTFDELGGFWVGATVGVGSSKQLLSIQSVVKNVNPSISRTFAHACQCKLEHYKTGIHSGEKDLDNILPLCKAPRRNPHTSSRASSKPNQVMSETLRCISCELIGALTLSAHADFVGVYKSVDEESRVIEFQSSKNI